MPKRYQHPKLAWLEDVDEDVITTSPDDPETGDNDVGDEWGDDF